MIYPVIFPFLGADVGGSHLSTFRMGRALKQYFGLESLVLCPEGSRIAAEASGHGIAVAFTGERPASRNSPLYDLSRYAGRAALLARYSDRQTIVHANDLQALQAWAPCSRLIGRRVVYHHRSLNSASLKIRMRLALADAIIAVSDACLQNLHHVRPPKVVKITNCCSMEGVDRAAARRNLLRDTGVPADRILIGFVANFRPRKRPYFFLDTARHIAAEEPRVHFLVFGHAGEISRAQLETYAETLGVRDAVSFMGFRSPPVENIAALDVLLIPALKEPGGSTPVEASLVGTPYVATADTGHLESARRWQGGLLVPKEASAAEFSEAALKVVRGDVSLALPAERREEIARELSPRVHAEAVLEVYRRVSRSPAFKPSLPHGLEAPQ